MSKHKTALFVFAVLSGILPCRVSAEPMWSWVSGSKTTLQYGLYGTMGVPAWSNVPGARHCSVSWTDPNGDLWLFGGYGMPASGSSGYMNDLWKYSNYKWTWVSGSNITNQPGVYGTKGVAHSNNVPGARYLSVSWADANGNLWLFGGSGYVTGGSGWLNDLWKYNIATGLWTWVSGSNSTSQSGIYGTKGVPASGSVPGSRDDAISWIDADGDLWLFGGYGHATSGSISYLNDLWKFDGVNWTWVSGSKLAEQPGVYGTKGLPDANNVPGARHGSISWVDSGGCLWLFGGDGRAASGTGRLNDLWKFDGSGWTWVSGSNSANQPGVYGTQNTPTLDNVPGARSLSISWIDVSGNFWLMGGYGYASSGSAGNLNDLWKFDGVNWTWVSGESFTGAYGAYGTQGQPASGNMPGARYNSVSWTDADGRLKLFGGRGYAATGSSEYLNDMWRFGFSEWAANLEYDGTCDYLDLRILASQWLTNPTVTPSADIAPQPAGDGIVNFRDFAVLASLWMYVFTE